MIAKTIETHLSGVHSLETLDYMASVLDSSTHYSFIAVNRDGLILLWNEGARTTYGYDADEILGRANWEMLFESSDVLAAKHHEMVAAALDTGVWEGNLVQVRKNAQRFAAHCVVNPWRDRRGESVGFILITREIVNGLGTPLPEAQPAEQAPADPWSDLLQRKHLENQLRQAQKMEAVGRLAGGVAHDFNNLLTVINGYSEILIDSFHHGDPLREYVEQIRRAGERAAALTRQLLTFSRKQMIVPVILDLNGLLSEMAKMLSRLIGEDIELRMTTGPDLWKVNVDPGQIEQVVMNLVVNARDAMPKGGKLHIETANVELGDGDDAQRAGKPSPHVLLTVSDSGCGMDALTQSRIFEPFFTTKGPDKGTGLGLATVYGIVKQSNGRIDVLSQPGIGTNFKIFLPRAVEDAAHVKAHRPLSAPHRGTETVLLVEDEEGVRTLTRLVLEKNGYKVVEARNGDEGLLRCQHHPGTIDIMVTDVVMPTMSGATLAQHLATLRPDMKVLYLSGYTDEAILRHGVVDPDMPFLQKPFTTDALARKLREVLDVAKETWRPA